MQGSRIALVEVRGGRMSDSVHMVSWFEEGDVSWLRSLAPDWIVAIDVETTGLDPEVDEIIQIACVDGSGEPLIDSLVRPVRRHEESDAKRITGINPGALECQPSFGELASEMSELFGNAALIVGYNLAFDLRFLSEQGVLPSRVVCFDVMREFAPVARKRAAAGGFRMVPLAECARYYGMDIVPHDALEDARATCACFRRMLEDDGSRFGLPGSMPYLEAVRRHFS